MRTQKLSNQLAHLSEAELADWAEQVMSSITDQHAKALDIAGWKIVSKDNDGARWPFDSRECGFDAPSWCHDLGQYTAKQMANMQVWSSAASKQQADLQRYHPDTTKPQ